MTRLHQASIAAAYAATFTLAAAVINSMTDDGAAILLGANLSTFAIGPIARSSGARWAVGLPITWPFIMQLLVSAFCAFWATGLADLNRDRFSGPSALLLPFLFAMSFVASLVGVSFAVGPSRP
jgi:hypothetical protein